jgi:hypothetical protein
MSLVILAAFVYPLLAFGALAFLIPLIIHLLNKRRFKTVYWGAVHLLEDIIRKNNKRLNLEQLLLLLIRIGIPILLAFCLARPVLTGVRQFLGDEKTSTVVLLDNSFSMQAGGATGSASTQSREAVSQLVENLPNGSDVSVVLAGGEPRTLTDEPTTATDAIPASLANQSTPGNLARLPDALRMATAEFGRMNYPAKELVVISDFRQKDWLGPDASSRAAAQEALKAMPLPPRVTFYQVGNPNAENLAVESMAASSLILAKNQPFSLRANIRNHGKAPRQDVTVRFSADGTPIRSSKVKIPPGGEAQLLFTHSFPTAGDHAVEITVEGDIVEADNSFFAVLPVWDQVPVTLVDGEPGNQPLEGEMDFLDIALQPFSAAGRARGLQDLIKPAVIRQDRLNRDAFKDAKVVILGNIPRVEDWQRNDLEAWVKNGGSVLLFTGGRCDVKHYNDTLFRNGAGPLPARMTGLGGSKGLLVQNAPVTRIVNQRYTHPSLEFFADPQNGKLGDAEFFTWQKLELPPAAAGESASRLVASLDSGDPWLVEKSFGKGRVMLCATPADADWGNLPTQPFFLPLMQRLVTYLAVSVTAPTNLQTGEPLLLSLPASEAGRNRMVIDPAGNQKPVTPRKEGENAILEYPDTAQPGIYTILPPEGSQEGPAKFAFNFNRLESDLTPLSEQEVQDIAAGLNASVVKSREEYLSLDKLRREGQEIWKPLLWGLLLFLFAEIFLQQWMARRSL